MDDPYKFKKAVTTMLATKQDNGSWKVDITVVQSRKEEEDLEWQNRSVGISTIDADLGVASGDATSSLYVYLEKYNGDLFSVKEKDGYSNPNNEA